MITRGSDLAVVCKTSRIDCAVCSFILEMSMKSRFILGSVIDFTDERFHAKTQRQRRQVFCAFASVREMSVDRLATRNVSSVDLVTGG